MKIKSTKTLQRKLDEIFSKYIRRSNADKNGIARCASCGKIDTWQEMDCGHFVSRQYLYTRYDERNCAPQCKKCNRFEEGNKEGYSLYLIRKYGANIFEELNENKWKPFINFPYEAKIKEYQQKLKELK